MSSDKYFERAGASIAYQFEGSGPPLGYAHGVPLSRKAVRSLELFDFDALGDGRSMLVYDQRGHGQSTGRPIPEDYLFENFAQDLLALLDALKITEPMDFAGSSLGCDTALRAAIAAPHRFRRLVLMIPPVAWTSEAEQAKQWYFDSADKIDEVGAAQWRRQWAQAEPPPIFADYPNYRFSPDVSDELLPSVLRGVGRSDLPAPEAIATLTHPTLILAWDTDPLHPVSTAERLHELIPGSQLHVSTSVADIKTWTDRITEFVTV
ncbi:alpha/beta fold hydrolase [Amycolatopsis keratiniphila]|uniref:alpha/beta fold hydrolase n=1 Tax=Amycolatopsis keratiniphila TaxID=129921 RepID=UPI00087C336C|nr:alpha/beta hydrolase [Amycolatopsis keratiniphila]OLZ51578.1 alpha/beta hydrolase [Amycolatopsis keratiniphila subsp. nogabecina]SDU11386.1 Pimeloyl-ACP methyl ester carboxylesterase [Amycolatopsis keratiniphila]